MKIYCPKCNQEYDISTDCIGKKGECEKCSHTFLIEDQLNLANLLFNEIYFHCSMFEHNIGNSLSDWIRSFGKYIKSPFINKFLDWNEKRDEDPLGDRLSLIFFQKHTCKEYIDVLESEDIAPYVRYKYDDCYIKSHKAINNCCIKVTNPILKDIFPNAQCLNCRCYLEKVYASEKKNLNELFAIPSDYQRDYPFDPSEPFDLAEAIIKIFDLAKYNVQLIQGYKSESQIKYLESRLEFWKKDEQKSTSEEDKKIARDTVKKIEEQLNRF